MLIKYFTLKKNNMANIIHLNNLLGIMITIILDHKLLDTLIKLIKIK